MIVLVLNASTALAGLLPDEGDPSAAAALDLLGLGQAIVPAIWPAEVLNGLVLAVRKGRLGTSPFHDLIEGFGRMPIQIDSPTHGPGLTRLARLARETGLTTYDASYLALAMEQRLPLATRDQQLSKAAQTMRVKLWDVSR